MLFPQFLPCIHPYSQSIALAIIVLLVIYLVIAVKILPKTGKPAIGAAAAVFFLVLWLGSYPFSPLGFSDGHIPILSGFTVTTRTKHITNLAPGEIVTLASGSPAEIEPVLLLAMNTKCNWSSSNGGTLDSPDTCDLVYIPPQADFDILKIKIRPGCGLPQSTTQIKVSILP